MEQLAGELRYTHIEMSRLHETFDLSVTSTNFVEGSVKTMLLLTAGGPLVILTSYASALEPALIAKLKAKGVRKFVAFDIPLELAKQRYANHFVVVAHDLHEADDLRVLDFDGQHAFQLFAFAELGQPMFYEGT